MLSVSREDILVDDIQEYGANERFIKLPIKNYMKLLPVTDPVTGRSSTMWDCINRPQIALINAINSPNYRFVSAALSRRLGKTYIANIIGQLVTLIPNCNVLIMSPNYNLSSISFDLQRKFIKQFDLELVRDNIKDRIIELANGSTIRMGSITQVDSCVGRSYDLIIFDEAALSTEGQEAFNIALRPTLDKVNSKAIFISTPRGRKNWFSEFYQRGFGNEFSEWCSITADYTENPRMSQKDVDEAKKIMSIAEFEQEYMASFNTFEGKIYYLNDTNILEEHPPLEEMEVIAGLDPGYKDYTAFIIIGYHYPTDTFYILEDYLEKEMTTAQHAEAMTKLIEKWNIQNIFIDAAAAQMGHDLAYLYDIATTKAKKDVLPGIAYCQNLVEHGQIKINPQCRNSLDMFDQYQWDMKEGLTKDRPLHNRYSHMADAFRYCLYNYVR